MRAAHAAIAAAGLLSMALAISAGGQRLAASETTIEIDAPEDLPPDTLSPDALPPEDDAAEPEAPQAEAGALERVAPRAPLSELALAAPAKPKEPPRAPDAVKEWTGEPLFQPVAPAAGEIEASGVSVVISGIEATPPEETCTDGAGRDWACGMRARTAFRAFLRNRAVTCGEPEAGSRPAAQCSIGKKDIGLWLVENGWARAVAGGPYADAGDKARAAGKGIFGPAPDLSSLPPEPSIVVAPLAGPDQPSSILDLSGTATTPPAANPATPLQVFPPAPGR